jgi:phospholipase C
MDNATPRLSWKIYTANPSGSDPAKGTGYIWSMCPYFADCLYTFQANNMVATSNLITDAQNGTLPNVSFAIPANPDSQHNGFSMQQGENWINSLVTPLMNGPEWSSTAIFLMWDDCGCFYDHVGPPKRLWGIRVPLLVISPYAKPGYTDSTPATFASMLAYTEHVFELAPLTNADRYGYDYADSFSYSQPPLTAPASTRQTIPRTERRYIAAHSAAAAMEGT